MQNILNEKETKRKEYSITIKLREKIKLNQYQFSNFFLNQIIKKIDLNIY
jgi:hypothetical protein